jgi:UDP-N-acetylmuramoyl-L-alanyl-D-glutamate--2,6-diaminopimelate ligase
MLSEFEGRLGVTERRGPLDAEVRAATADSRAVAPGTLFAAIPGTRLDGHRFVPQAVEAGASAVLLSRWPEAWPASVVGLRVDDPRRSLAVAASALLHDPSGALRTFGVTGTNGKTSTVAILASILRAAGTATATMGTTGFDWDAPGGRQHARSTHTTPEGPELHGWLARFRDDGVGAVALELSSHALEQGRAAGLALDVAAWSNLSRDHLDYHGTMAAYAAAKALLFTELLPRWGKDGAAAVLNVDDPAVAAAAPSGRVVRVSARGADADVRARGALAFSRDGIEGVVSFGGVGVPLKSRLLGAHNADNLLLAGAMAWAAGVDLSAIERGWRDAVGAPGRLERVEGPGPLVLVDYAHTPDALRKVLATLRPLCAGRLHVLFGAGGDRDAGKRPLMAQAAAEGADRVVITSDNPRSEDPEAILDAVQAGLDGTAVPFDRFTSRAVAIARIVSSAADDDVVLLAGKGHETTQEIGGVTIPFDDREHARRALVLR